jgi:hypothetical protein
LKELNGTELLRVCPHRGGLCCTEGKKTAGSPNYFWEINSAIKEGI